MFSPNGLRIGNYPPQGVMAPHAHPEPGISIVVRGGFVEHIGRQARNYARGQIAYLPAGTVHSQAFGGRGARQVIFRPQEVWLGYLTGCGGSQGHFRNASAPAFGLLGDRLVQELGHDDDVSVLACEGLMLEIMAAFTRRGFLDPYRGPVPPWLRRAKEFIDQHWLASFSLKDVACAAGRHEIHLAREFRRFFGASVGAYLRRLRTDEAARLLASSQPITITEIALCCGFSSHPHLCREFRRRFGVSPSEYRRAVS
jgi:AraC family transcriptional regulator